MKSMMEHNKIVLGLVASLFLAMVACSSPKNLIVTEFEALKPTTANLMYEYSYTSSSATGNCSGIAFNWWYGSEEEPEQVIDSFEKQLLGNGWETWPEDVVPIWRKESNDGLLTLSMHVFTHEEEIDPNMAYYTLPDSVIIQSSDFQSVFFIAISHMSPSVADRCFGN